MMRLINSLQHEVKRLLHAVDDPACAGDAGRRRETQGHLFSTDFSYELQSIPCVGDAREV